MGGLLQVGRWALSERAAAEKRQQLGDRSRAVLIQAVEGAVILC